MKSIRFATVIAALLALAALAPGALAGPADNDATATSGATWQGGTSLDQADGSTGGWDNTDPGIANRPYIRYLGVTNADGTEMTVIDNQDASPSQTPEVGTIGGGPFSNIYAFVSPTNSCRDGQDPAPGVCYATPNRVTVWIAVKGGGGYQPSLSDFDPGTILPNVTTDSVIHLIIGFHASYSTLRWSWVSGEPTYWRSTVAPGSDGVVEVRFRPSLIPRDDSPAFGGCSRIPVEGCDVTTPDAEILMPQIVLSMDDTLDASLAGTVFGTDDAVIGSLELNRPSGDAPTVTYGVAAPHEFADGTLRKGTFYALLPSPLLALFGTGVDAFDGSVLSIARTGDAGSYATGWAAWNEADNGTAGEFLTISDISFSAPKFRVKPKTSVRKGGTITLAKLAAARRMKRGAYSAKTLTKAVCRVKAGKVVTLKRGVCKVSLTSKPRAGAKQTKRVSFLVY